MLSGRDRIKIKVRRPRDSVLASIAAGQVWTPVCLGAAFKKVFTHGPSCLFAYVASSYHLTDCLRNEAPGSEVLKQRERKATCLPAYDPGVPKVIASLTGTTQWWFIPSILCQGTSTYR